MLRTPAYHRHLTDFGDIGTSPCRRRAPVAPDDGPAFLVESEAFPDFVLLRAIGDLDLAAVTAFSAALDTARLTVGKAVIDMSGVSFIDSTGLHSIERAGRAGLAIVVRNPSRLVRRLLDATGLAGILTIEQE